MTAGRKLFDGKDEKEVVSKLQEYFMIGYTDEQACLLTGISRSALDRYEKINSEFRDKKHLWKKDTLLYAKNNIRKKILAGDIDISKWYLERKCKEEFGANVKIHGEMINQNINYEPELTLEQKEQLEKEIEAIRDVNGLE